MWLDPYNIITKMNTSGSTIDFIISTILVLASVVVLSRRNINISMILRNNVWITVFYIYCGISVFWSEFPFDLSIRFIKNICYLLPFLIVLTEKDRVEAINKLVRRSGIILIPLSFIFIKYFHEISRYYEAYTGKYYNAGVSYNKNGLGSLCLICGLFYFWNIMDDLKNRNEPENKKDFLTHFVIFIMTLWVMYLTDSATSSTCLLVGIFIISLTRFPVITKRYKAILMLLLFSVIIIYISDLYLLVFKAFTGKIGRDTTLTGRDTVWEVSLRGVSNQWIGSGYGGFWKQDKTIKIMNEIWDTPPNQAHNGYLDLYLNLGYIGVVIFFAMMLSAFREISRKIIYYKDFGGFCVVYFIVFLLYNITEAAFKDLHPLWNLFLLMAIDYKSIKGLRNNYLDEGFVPSRSGAMA